MSSLRQASFSLLLLLCLQGNALAQSPSAMMGMLGMGGMAAQADKAPRDCSKSPHPEKCTARQEARTKAKANCEHLQGKSRRECMLEQRKAIPR